MTDPKDLPPALTILRRRAEARLTDEALPPEDFSPDQAARLIQEFRVQQIELEMQNEELRLSQAQLEESRSKYADLYDFAPVGYLTLDIRGKIVEANLTAATLLGVERSKLVNRFFSHFLVDADRRVFRQLMNNGLNQRERRGEFHLQDGGGNVRVMLLDILLLTDAAGQERRRISLTDITELNRTQEELRLHKEKLEELVAQRTTELNAANEQLREANDNLEALFQASPLGIAVFDDQGRMRKINPASERIFGWSQEELKGHLPPSIIPEAPEESLAIIQRLLQGETIIGVELKQQRQDGSKIDISFSGAPLHEANGKLRGFIGLAEDITERKKLEEAEHTQALVLEGMAEGVNVTDQQGNIIYTNPAFDAMFGYEPGELLGRPANILNRYSPEENTRLVKDILKSVDTSGVWSGEFHNCKKNGLHFLTSGHISTLVVGGKKLLVSVQEDITRRKRDEEMLRRQAELLDLAQDAILVRDLMGRITYWNRGAEELYGWESDKAQEKVEHSLLATEFPQPLESIETYLLEHGRWEGELIHTTRDGRRLIVASRWSLKRDEAGRPLAILEINHDITARRQAEEALRKIEQRFRSLVEANVVGMVVSNEETIIEANDAFLRMVGYTREEMLAGDLQWVVMTPREYLPQDARALYELRTTGSHNPFEKTFLRKDGTQVSVVAGGALLEEDPLCWVSFVLDITERKQLEDTLRQSEARFRAIFTNASIGMATTDLEGRLQQFNAPVIRGLGYTPAELQGLSFLDLTHPDDLAVDKDLFQELVTGRRDHYQVEKRYIRKDGQVFWARHHVALVRGMGGEPDFTVSLVEDITARKEAQAALAESEVRYRSLVELSPDAILVHVRGRIMFVNQAACQLFGAGNPQEILGQRILNLVHPDSLELVKQRVKQVYAGERVDLREIKILRLDGQVVEVESAATPVIYSDQPAVLVMVRNITVRRRVEEEIRSLASFPELNPNPILEMNEDGQVVYANPAALRDAEKLKVTAGAKAFVPQGLKKFFARARRGGPREYSYDLSLEGAVFAVTLNLPHDLPTARLYALDITERKRAEVALAKRQAEFEAIFHSISDGVVFADPERRIVMVNPAAEALFGYTSEEMHGRLGELIYASREDFEEQGRRRYHLQADEPQPPYEITYRRKDGSVFPAESRGCQVKDTQGRVIGFVSINRDITARKQSEEALQRSQEDLNRAQAVAHIGSWRLDVRKNELSWSDETCRIFGISPGTPLTYETFLAMVHPEDQEYVKQKWAATLRGEPYDIEHRIIVDDAVKWVRERAELEFDAGGKLLGGFGTVQDITERKRAEEALRRSEANERSRAAELQAILDTAPGIILLAHDPEGRMITGNRAAYELMRRSPGGNLSKSAMEGERPENFRTMKDGREITGAELPVQRAAAGETMRDFEVTLVFDDGAVRHILGDAVPLLDEAGRPRGSVAAFLDITERKEMEEALRRAHDELEERVEERTTSLRLVNELLLLEIEERQQAEERFRDSEARFTAFMEYLPGLAVMRDMEGHYLYANPAWEKVVGLEPGTWRGKTLKEVLPPEQAEDFQKLDFQVISSGQPVEEVEMLNLADGPHYLLSHRFPIRDKNGLAYMVGATAIDITARKQAEKQVEETGRLYRVLSQVNEAIIRGRDQSILFEQVCRIVVEEGLFRMAWVGLIDPEGQTIQVATKYGFDEGYLDDLVISAEDDVKSEGPTGTAVRENRYDVCNDFAAEPRMAPWRDQALARGYRSSGAFPLRIGDEVVGALTLYAHRPAFFTDKEIDLLTSLADNLSFALEFLDQEEKRRRAEEALAEHAAMVLDLYNNAPCGYQSLDPKGNFVEVNDTELAWLGYTREEVVGRLNFSDILAPQSLKIFRANFPGFKKRGWVKDLEFELIRKDGSVFPVLLNATAITDQTGNYLMSRSTMFDITERKRAEEVIKESEIKLRYLAEKLLTAQENERRRLAAELHDELGHMLLTLKLSLSSISEELLPDQVSLKEEIQDQLKNIKDVIVEIRRMYNDLSPGDVEDLGLTPALENLVENFASLQGHIIFKTDLPDLNRLFSLPVQTIIYRMVQEALTNIGKHANPEHVTVEAVKEGTLVRFTIEDDGQGFDVAQVRGAAGRGVGLAAMEERLRMVGGTLDIRSREQEGTRLSFTIPVSLEGDQP